MKIIRSLLLLGLLGGCAYYPGYGPGYIAPTPIVVAPAPVVTVAPSWGWGWHNNGCCWHGGWGGGYHGYGGWHR